MKSKDKAQLSLFDLTEEVSPQLKEKFHYLFVVSPSNEIKEKIKQLKDRLKEIVPLASLAIRSTPHISVSGFQTSKRLDAPDFDKLNTVFQEIPRFAISFNGFDNFLHGQVSNTLYIVIEDEQPLMHLNKVVAKFFGLNDRTYKPHMTIAKALPRETLENVNAFIQNEQFKMKFMCTGITVLESIVEGNRMGAYSVCKTFDLKDAR